MTLNVANEMAPVAGITFGTTEKVGIATYGAFVRLNPMSGTTEAYEEFGPF